MSARIRRGLVTLGAVFLASLLAAPPAFGGFPITALEVTGSYSMINPPGGEHQTMFGVEEGRVLRVKYSDSTGTIIETLEFGTLYPVSWLNVESVFCTIPSCDRVNLFPRIPISGSLMPPFTIYDSIYNPQATFDLMNPADLQVTSTSLTFTSLAPFLSGTTISDGGRAFDLSMLNAFELVVGRMTWDLPMQFDPGSASPAGFGTFSWPDPPGTITWKLFIVSGGAVPEPTSLALVAAGVLTVAVFGWYRRRAQGHRNHC